MAYQMYLEGWLQESVMSEVLSISEAWSVQDRLLLEWGERIELPPSLWPLMQRLELHQQPLQTRH